MHTDARGPHTHTHTNRRARTRTHTHTLSHTHARTRARARMHALTHARTELEKGAELVFTHEGSREDVLKAVFDFDLVERVALVDVELLEHGLEECHFFVVANRLAVGDENRGVGAPSWVGGGKYRRLGHRGKPTQGMGSIASSRSMAVVGIGGVGGVWW